MTSEPRVRLIHWHSPRAAESAALLQATGYDVVAGRLDADVLRELKQNPPAAVVIDLDRQPSSGRDLAVTLRQNRSTRHVPLVLAGGAPEKVAPIRGLVPDAVYTAWAGIVPALERALANPPTEPVVPGSVFAAYASTPLARKLGIQANWMVALVDAPEGIEATLGPLPEGVSLARNPDGPRDLTLWFVRSRARLESGIASLTPHAGRGRLWIAWPKVASGLAGDLSHDVVQQRGLAAGLMDYKVCSVDATWTALRFTLAKPGKPEQEP